jgi:hypothetical protein
MFKETRSIGPTLIGIGGPKRLKLLVGELAPLQRELAALEKQERDQTDSIKMWFDRPASSRRNKLFEVV